MSNINPDEMAEMQSMREFFIEVSKVCQKYTDKMDALQLVSSLISVAIIGLVLRPRSDKEELKDVLTVVLKSCIDQAEKNGLLQVTDE